MHRLKIIHDLLMLIIKQTKQAAIWEEEEREIFYFGNWGIEVLINFLIFESVFLQFCSNNLSTEIFPLLHLHITILVDSSFQISMQVISGTICEEEIDNVKLLSIHSSKVCFLLVKSMALCLLSAFITVCLL